MKIYSFDIFDTVLQRKIADPKGIFSVMQFEMLQMNPICFPQALIHDFYSIRVATEEKVRNESEKEEVTLEEIYEDIRRNYQLSQQQMLDLIDLELQTELRYIVPVKRNLSIIEELHKQGVRIIFISDMYLSAAQIKKLLAAALPDFAQYPVYVSSEFGVCKHSGKLFKLVLQHEKLDKSNLCHYGDNYYSDYKVPATLGIQAHWLPKATPESCFSDYSTDQRLYLQLLAGIQRGCDTENTEYKVAYSFCGAMLYGYVKWCLDTAVAQGAKRIYFLSRDGAVMLKIAEKIQQQYHLPIQLKYLMISRQICNSAYCADLTDSRIDHLKLFMENLEIFSQRTGSSTAPGELGVPELAKMADKPLNDQQKNKILKTIRSNQKLKKAIESHLKEQRELFFDYLTQEDFFQDNSSWLVDIGWSGKMQDMFYSVVSERYPQKTLKWFYFSTYHSGVERFSEKTSCNNYKQIYSDVPVSLRHHACAIEIITAAGHGTVIGYQRQNTVVVPLLGHYDFCDHASIQTFFAGISDFAHDFSLIESQFPGIFDAHRQLCGFFLEKIKFPSRELAETIGKRKFSFGYWDAAMNELAPAFNFFRMANILRRHGLYISAWVGGSLQRSSLAARSSYYGYSYSLTGLKTLRSQIKQFKKQITSYSNFRFGNIIK